MAKRKPSVGICEEHARYKDICVPCAEVRGAARALRALAREWKREGFDKFANEALRRARKCEGGDRGKA